MAISLMDKLAKQISQLSTKRGIFPWSKSEMLKGIKTLSQAQQKTLVQAIKAGGQSAAQIITSTLTPILANKTTEAVTGQQTAKEIAKANSSSTANLESILNTMYNREAEIKSESQNGSTTDHKTGGIDN